MFITLTGTDINQDPVDVDPTQIEDMVQTDDVLGSTMLIMKSGATIRVMESPEDIQAIIQSAKDATNDN